MRIKLLSLAVASTLAFTSAAQKHEYHNDMLELRDNELSLEYIKATTASQPDNKDIELLVFYQPSYGKKFGEYEMYRRVWEWVETVNSTYDPHELGDYNIIIQDVIPITSVGDDVPFFDVKDENGNIIQDGAQYLVSGALHNEGYPEYDLIQKWQPDLINYTAEVVK